MRVSTGRQVNKSGTSPFSDFCEEWSVHISSAERARRRDLTVAEMDASIQRSPAAMQLLLREQQRDLRALFDGNLRVLKQRFERARACFRCRANSFAAAPCAHFDGAGQAREIDWPRRIVDELEGAVVRESGGDQSASAMISQRIRVPAPVTCEVRAGLPGARSRAVPRRLRAAHRRALRAARPEISLRRDASGISTPCRAMKARSALRRRPMGKRAQRAY